MGKIKITFLIVSMNINFFNDNLPTLHIIYSIQTSVFTELTTQLDSILQI